MAFVPLPGHDGYRCDGNCVSRHARIQNQPGGIKIVDKEQPCDSQDYRSNGEGTEEIGVNAVSDPKQHDGFHQPANGDPVSVQPDGNRDGDESNGQCQMQ